MSREGNETEKLDEKPDNELNWNDALNVQHSSNKILRVLLSHSVNWKSPTKSYISQEYILLVWL